jgi:peptidoglycan hydrolase-like protein with peptidoglycan-binding domain
VTLPAEPNRTIPLSLRSGDTGWPVYALQGGLSALGYQLSQDGTFGSGTDNAVRRFQRAQGLAIDGIAGIGTQGAIVHALDEIVHDAHPDIPAGLLRGFAESEGGNNLGATNWHVAGGVDCGIVQVRVFGPPYSVTQMQAAFGPWRAMTRVAEDFLDRRTTLGKLPTAHARGAEFTDRCAALSWNWPFAAEQYARNGHLPDPGRNATWAVVNGVRIRFPDGAPVLTWADWAQFYAMGGPHGEGRVTRYIRWT